MVVRQGYLLITDITGYTQFLVSSELQHAKEILDTLLQSTIDAIEPPIEVLNTRGDAVVAYVSEGEFLQPQSLLESIESIYFDFRRQLGLMDLNTTCTCNACINMTALDLKLFLHFGEYIEQVVGGATELQGADVILANLLLKNGVTAATGLRGYALITETALDAMGREHLPDGLRPHVERYDHFGDVATVVWDLPALWESARSRDLRELRPEDAWVVESVTTPAPQWVAWDYATDAGQKRVYYDMISVDRVDDLGGPVRVGSRYHCAHELGDVTFMIKEWHPPHHFSSDEVALGTPVDFTMQVEADESGSTLRILYLTPQDGDPNELEPLFRGAARDALQRLAAILENAGYR